ncbi:FAD-binding protein [Streptomyces diastatochromogenes]|nr:FAD-binding protein [Streptomyces diastatochromogenes]
MSASGGDNRDTTTSSDFDQAVEALARQVKGTVLTPRDEGYDAERAGNQTGRTHRPAVLVGASGPADVQQAVVFAARHGLPVAVQGTGHALGAVASEGGVLINTSRMTGVRIDTDTATAWVAAEVSWDQVIHEAAPPAWPRWPAPPPASA